MIASDCKVANSELQINTRFKREKRKKEGEKKTRRKKCFYITDDTSSFCFDCFKKCLFQSRGEDETLMYIRQVIVELHNTVNHSAAKITHICQVG